MNMGMYFVQREHLQNRNYNYFLSKKSYLEQLNFFTLNVFSNLKIFRAFLVKVLNIVSTN